MYIKSFELMGLRVQDAILIGRMLVSHYSADSIKLKKLHFRTSASRMAVQHNLHSSLVKSPSQCIPRIQRNPTEKSTKEFLVRELIRHMLAVTTQ